MWPAQRLALMTYTISGDRQRTKHDGLCGAGRRTIESADQRSSFVPPRLREFKVLSSCGGYRTRKETVTNVSCPRTSPC